MDFYDIFKINSFLELWKSYKNLGIYKFIIDTFLKAIKLNFKIFENKINTSVIASM